MTRLLALPILLALPLAAVAQPDEINYLYLELGLEQTRFDVPGSDIEADGPSIEGSVPIREHIHLFGGYGASEFDDIPDADGIQKYAGIGTHFGIGQKLSVFGRLGFIEADRDIGLGTVEDDGVLVSGGVRYMPVPGWEIRGGFDYIDLNLDLGDSETFGRIGSDLFLTDVVALTVDLTLNDDANSIFLGARFYFGNERPTSRLSR